MKTILLALMLSMLTLPCLGQAAKDEAYPVTVHVTRSEVMFAFGDHVSLPYLTLEATIEGHKYKLLCEKSANANAIIGVKPEVLRIGDYTARVAKEKVINAAQYFRQYELLLEGGTKLKFDVIGESEN